MTELMVSALVDKHQARGHEPLAVEELAAELSGMLPGPTPARERELVLAQVIGRVRDLADAGRLIASADYSLVLGPGARVPACLPSPSSSPSRSTITSSATAVRSTTSRSA